MPHTETIHEIRVGHDQAKCNIKNSSIAAAQLAKHQNIVLKRVRLALSTASSNAKRSSTQLQHMHWLCLGE
jgi:hypothetical protein